MHKFNLYAILIISTLFGFRSEGTGNVMPEVAGAYKLWGYVPGLNNNTLVLAKRNVLAVCRWSTLQDEHGPCAFAVMKGTGPPFVPERPIWSAAVDGKGERFAIGIDEVIVNVLPEPRGFDKTEDLAKECGMTAQVLGKYVFGDYSVGHTHVVRTYLLDLESRDLTQLPFVGGEFLYWEDESKLLIARDDVCGEKFIEFDKPEVYGYDIERRTGLLIATGEEALKIIEDRLPEEAVMDWHTSKPCYPYFPAGWQWLDALCDFGPEIPSKVDVPSREGTFKNGGGRFYWYGRYAGEMKAITTGAIVAANEEGTWVLVRKDTNKDWYLWALRLEW